MKVGLVLFLVFVLKVLAAKQRGLENSLQQRLIGELHGSTISLRDDLINC